MSEGKVGLEAYPFHCPPVSPISFFIPVLSSPSLSSLYPIISQRRLLEERKRDKGIRPFPTLSSYLLSFVHDIMSKEEDKE